MKQQKLVYITLRYHHKSIDEIPLQEYFDEGWKIESYQSVSLQDGDNMNVVVLLTKEY